MNNISQFIDAFAALRPADRQAVLIEISRICDSDAGPLSDNELIAAGESLFGLYDKEEATDAQSETR